MPPSSIHSRRLRLTHKALDPGLDLLCLFKRAIDNPASVTRAENNQIRRLPPPDDEDRQIRETLPCDSREELVSKAVVAPDSLTRDEVDYLVPRYGRCFEEEDDRLMFAAIDAINLTMSSDEKRAVSNAYKRQSRWEAERAEREERLKWREYLASLPRAVWVQRMVDADLGRWGFVCFRTAYGAGADDERRVLFKTWYRGAGEHVALIWMGFRDLWSRHMTQFVSDASLEGCSTERLRERFRNMRATGEIPDGLRTDVFLVADEQAIADDCITRNKPYSTTPCIMNVFGKANMHRGRVDALLLRAVDPDYNTATIVPMEGPYAGYRGELSFRLPKTFDWLHYSFWAGSETWENRYWQTREMEWAPYKIRFATYPAYGP